MLLFLFVLDNMTEFCQHENLKGGEYMDKQSQPMGKQPSTKPEDIHQFRKEIDAVIQKSQAIQNDLMGTAGAREISLVVTKLQEGKMWAGKILEAMGSPFPPELADKAA